MDPAGPPHAHIGLEMDNDRPVVIALASPKGGAGKTMAAILLACEAANSGSRVLIIDADPQGSSKRWFENSRRGGFELARINCLAIVERPQLIKTLRETQDVDLVLIDIQGTAEAAQSGALVYADLVLIPTRAHVADCRQAIAMAQYVEGLGGRDRAILYRILFNAVDVIEAKSSASKIARGILETAKTPVMATELYNRISFKNVATEGSLYEQTAITQAIRTAQQNVRDLMNELVEIVNEGAEA